MNIEELGFTREEIMARVVERIARQATDRLRVDPETNDEWWESSGFARELDKRVKESIDAAIKKLGDEFVLPHVSELVEGVCLQETNTWGEKTGNSLTFIEYLVQRAENYLTEKVNYEGKTKEESRNYMDGKQTRVTYLVHKHLQYSIDYAMKDAIKNANAVIVGGIEETVKVKLKEIAEKLLVKVEVPR